MICPSGKTCTEEAETRSPLESDVPDVSPTELSCVEGDVLDNEEEVMWYVPKQGYGLNKIEMWKSQTSTSGFKVTYSSFMPESSNWLDVDYMFGETD